jgi:hypothetical protein
LLPPPWCLARCPVPPHDLVTPYSDKSCNCLHPSCVRSLPPGTLDYCTRTTT